MLIGGSEKITALVPKIYELSDGMLINGQYYVKDRLIPVPFEFSFPTGAYNTLSMNKKLNLMTNGTFFSEHSDFPSTKDCTDQTLCYSVVSNNYVTGSANELIHKYSEGKDLNLEHKATVTGGSNQSFDGYICQDDNFLYYFTKVAQTGYFCTWNKATLAVTTPLTITGANCLPHMKYLYDDTGYVYFLVRNGNDIHLYSYNKATLACTLLQSMYRYDVAEGETSTNINYSEKIEEIVPLGDKIFGYYISNIADPQKPLSFIRIDLNGEEAWMTREEVTFEWTEFVTGFNYQVAYPSIYNIVKVFISEDSPNKYVHLAFYNQNMENSAHLRHQGVYSFLMVDGSYTNLKCVGFNNFDATALVNGTLLSNDKNSMIVGFSKSFQLFRWNNVSNMFEKTGVLHADCISVGFDALERIWCIKSNFIVHLFSLEDAASVEIEFEKPYYEYDGANIETYFTFAAKNYMDEFFVGNFDLVLSGSAVFTENNTKALSITFNSKIPIQIPITITGPNQITVYPKYVTEM